MMLMNMNYEPKTDAGHTLADRARYPDCCDRHRHLIRRLEQLCRPVLIYVIIEQRTSSLFIVRWPGHSAVISTYPFRYSPPRACPIDRCAVPLR